LRIESGALPGGLRGYASYAYNTTERWQGVGRQDLQQVNLKAVQPIGEGTLTAFVNLSRRRESDPQDLTLAMVRRLGKRWDNIPNDWALAVRLAEIAANRGDTPVRPANAAAGTVYPEPFRTIDDAYFDSTTARDDALAAVTARIPVGNADLKATAYGHWDRGQGLWWTPFVASPAYGVVGATHDNAPISIRSTEYDIRRRGLLASGVQEIGAHSLSGGLWLEENDFVQERRFYGLDLARPQRDYRRFQTDPFRTDWAYHFSTRTRQLYVQDIWRPDEAFTVTAGFKSLSVTNRVATRVGDNKNGVLRAESPFLPRVSVAYRPTAHDEVFAHYGRGMRAFSSSNTSGPFAGSAVALAAIRPTLKPEISDSFEIGWRRHRGGLTLLTAAYGVRFHNRLFSTPVGGGILGNPSMLANVGSVTSYGLESALSWRAARDWSVFASYAFNHAVYDDDVFDGDGARIARTRGKMAVDAPRHLIKAHIDYERESAFAQFSASYLSHRYLTFENDQSVPAQFIANFVAGYRFSGSPWREGLTAQVNVTNLLNTRSISTIGSNDFAIRGDDLQTVLVGPPRQVFLSLRKTF
jgi:iron complex outermembrane receptor protein